MDHALVDHSMRAGDVKTLCHASMRQVRATTKIHKVPTPIHLQGHCDLQQLSQVDITTQSATTNAKHIHAHTKQ